MQGRNDGRTADEGGILTDSAAGFSVFSCLVLPITRVPDLRAVALCSSTSSHADSIWLKPALCQRVHILQGTEQKCSWCFALWPSLCQGGSERASRRFVCRGRVTPPAGWGTGPGLVLDKLGRAGQDTGTWWETSSGWVPVVGELGWQCWGLGNNCSQCSSQGETPRAQLEPPSLLTLGTTVTASK